MAVRDVHLDAQVVRRLLRARLRDQLPAGVTLIGPHRATPDPAVSPVWAQTHSLRETPGRVHQGAGEPDEAHFVMAISVGVAAATAQADPTTLERTLALIRRALHGWGGADATTTHSVDVDRVDVTPDDRPDPLAPVQSGAVTVTCIARRTAGNSIAGA